MGVPTFFRWVSYRYKEILISQKVFKEDINNLFLDLNCLIHPSCAKKVKESEKIKQVLIDMVNIINVIKPTDLIFISVDGVAPSSKINQQRSRRFRSVKQRIEIKKLYEKYNVEFLDDWDTNAISPGTMFMEKLSNQIIKTIKYQKKNNEIWKNVNIIYSNCHIAGEGEHKIKSYLIKNRKEYIRKNKTNIIYGLDSDLILLSMSLDIPRLYLFREKIYFDNYHVAMDEFQYLDIDLLKGFLVNDILKYSNTNINFQNVINDFVFLSFLVGNDFLPTIPSLTIRNKGLDNIIYAYIKVLRIVNKPLVILPYTFKIDFEFFKKLLHVLANKEHESLYRLHSRCMKSYVPKINISKVKNGRQLTKNEIELQQEIKKRDFIDMSLESNPVDFGKSGYKTRFYSHYFKFDNKENDYKNKVKDVCLHYIEGLKWNMLYYYNRKVPSWDWCYTYLKTPFVSDIFKNILDIEKSDILHSLFPKSSPYKPLNQLLAILPLESSNLLPDVYSKVMNDEKFEKYYPKEFEIDKLYHKYTWECKPIIEKIEKNKLLETVKQIKLNQYDEKINKNYKTAFLY